MPAAQLLASSKSLPPGARARLVRGPSCLQVPPGDAPARACLEQEAWLWQLATVLFSHLPACSGPQPGAALGPQHCASPTWSRRHVKRAGAAACCMADCRLDTPRLPSARGRQELLHLQPCSARTPRRGSSRGFPSFAGSQAQCPAGASGPEAMDMGSDPSTAHPAQRLTQLQRCAALSACLQVCRALQGLPVAGPGLLPSCMCWLAPASLG